MLHIKIDDDLKKQLEQEAREKGLSLNSYVRMLLIERGK
jgi:predicted HicB family RNase H-like nuclease